MFFAHRPLTGVVFMLIGMGIVYFFSFSTPIKDQVARWVFSAGGALFALMGFGAALWRYELRLDLLGRTYSGRKGFWPNPKSLKGSLDDLERIYRVASCILLVEYTYQNTRCDPHDSVMRLLFRFDIEAKLLRQTQINTICFSTAPRIHSSK